MYILFLTVVRLSDISERGIFSDLMRKFRDEGHKVYITSPAERRFKEQTKLIENKGVYILKVRTLNIQKANYVEKGIGTLLLEYQFHKAILQYFSDLKFDLILYSTPPITFVKVVEAIKKRDGAKSYLLLKDIFPQNAIDLGILKKNGFLYRFFRYKEKEMYAVSDYIGCMSPANVEYILKHNPQIQIHNIEVCPNSIELNETEIAEKDTTNIRKKYNIPEEATIFIYGGNLGKPQGLDFLLEVLESNNNRYDCFFIVIGSGTEWKRISDWFNSKNISNAILLKNLPKKEYDKLVKACDVGLIFLDNRFTIPNYPSRMLSYLEYKMPILVASDIYSDLGKIAEQNNYGFFTINGDIEDFNAQLTKLAGNRTLIKEMGENGYNFLLENYTVEKSYQIIMKHFSRHI